MIFSPGSQDFVKHRATFWIWSVVATVSSKVLLFSDFFARSKFKAMIQLTEGQKSLQDQGQCTFEWTIWRGFPWTMVKISWSFPPMVCLYSQCELKTWLPLLSQRLLGKWSVWRIFWVDQIFVDLPWESELQGSKHLPWAFKTFNCSSARNYTNHLVKFLWYYCIVVF